MARRIRPIHAFLGRGAEDVNARDEPPPMTVGRATTALRSHMDLRGRTRQTTPVVIASPRIGRGDSVTGWPTTGLLRFAYNDEVVEELGEGRRRQPPRPT